MIMMLNKNADVNINRYIEVFLETGVLSAQLRLSIYIS